MYTRFKIPSGNAVDAYAKHMLYTLVACLLLLCTSSPVFSQTANSKKAISKLRGAKLIVGLTGNLEVDQALQTAVDSFWNPRMLAEPMPRDEAGDKAKGNDRLAVLTTGEFRVRSRIPLASSGVNSAINWSILTAKKFTTIGISDGGKFERNFLANVNIPVSDADELPAAAVHFGVAYLDDYITSINRYKSFGDWNKSTKARRIKRLKRMTLYIPDVLFTKSISPEEFGEEYGYDYKVVPMEEWSRVVLEHEEGAAYTMVIKFAFSGPPVFAHVIMSAKDGKILAFVYTKVAANLAGIKLSRGNSFEMNKKMTSLYKKAVN